MVLLVYLRRHDIKPSAVISLFLHPHKYTRNDKNVSRDPMFGRTFMGSWLARLGSLTDPFRVRVITFPRLSPTHRYANLTSICQISVSRSLQNSDNTQGTVGHCVARGEKFVLYSLEYGTTAAELNPPKNLIRNSLGISVSHARDQQPPLQWLAR